MQTNSELDYDLSRPLASALLAKSPFVGIPLPGHAPLVFNRLKLVRALTGVKPQDVRVETAGEGGNLARFLVVEGCAGPRVRTRMKMLAIPASYWKTRNGRDSLAKWKVGAAPASKQAATAKRASLPKGFNHAVTTIKRLQKELANKGRVLELPNPAVPRDRDLANDYQRDEWLEVRASKRMRTLVGALAAQMKTASSRELYQAMRARGWSFTSYSEVRQPMKDSYAASYRDYLVNLWRFVAGASGHQQFFSMRYIQQPLWMREAKRRVIDPRGEPINLGWGPTRYYAKIEDIRARQSLEAQIASVAAVIPGAMAQANIDRLGAELGGKSYKRRDVALIQAEMAAAKADLQQALNGSSASNFVVLA